MSNQREPVNISGCLIIVVIVGMVVWNWDDISSEFSEFFRDEIESVNEAMTDCDELRSEIEDTRWCETNPNCMLSKDELIEDRENVRDWFHYCSEEHGMP